jgi:hypothetical protein
VNDGTEARAGEPAGVGDLRELVERARRGDRSVLAELRRELDERPEVWRHLGDLAGHALRAWVGAAAGPDLALAESLARKAAELREGLAGPDPPPVVRLLAERAAACWVQTYYCDAMAARPGGSAQQAALASRRQDAAHKRYMSALSALEAARKLPRPAPPAAAPEAEAAAPLAVVDGPAPEGGGGRKPRRGRRSQA